MKYSIRGRIKTSDGTNIINKINNYTLWKLNSATAIEENETYFTFETWLSNEIDKNGLFEDLKQEIDLYTGEINWHVCTHDEISPQPCVIAESYVR